ncbi:unnamed protein product [Pleuronectes platessa]|uniref:Uncharacterized protein n=1 Tax=Pleuronectes platessa TaxID=8262 RepID=A0A9N7W013_PLEPL|nr:unnamed protein product [Pleuronectes platessa]
MLGGARVKLTQCRMKRRKRSFSSVDPPQSVSGSKLDGGDQSTTREVPGEREETCLEFFNMQRRHEAKGWISKKVEVAEAKTLSGSIYSDRRRRPGRKTSLW